MLRAAIVEDDIRAAEQLQKYLLRYCEKKQEQIKITCFDQAIPFLESGTENYDVVFMDIDLPDLSGMKACQRLREQDERLIIIFVTSLAQYAVEGYGVNALDFMVKPINYYELSMKMEKVCKHVRLLKDSCISLSYSGGRRIIPVKSISYIEIDSHQILFHTDSGVIRTTGTLASVEEKLPRGAFSRCNSCYIVNLDRVTGVHYDDVYLEGETLKISRGKRKQFMQELAQFYGAKG